MKTQTEWADWEVRDVSDLDDKHKDNFSKPWICTAIDHEVVEFGTEDQACAFQRAKRIKAGRDPMTGEMTL